MPEIVTKAEAESLGLKRYFTGVPCKHGHVCERYVEKQRAGHCVQCAAEGMRKRRYENPERCRAYDLARKSKIRDLTNSRQKEIYRKRVLALRALEELGIEV